MKAILIPLALLSIGTGLVNAGTLTEAFEFTSNTPLSDGRAFTLGYSFTTSATLDIVALGYLNDGLSNSHDVGIWDTSGNLLASTTVLSTDPVTGNFQYDTITDLILTPGTYVIGGLYLGNNDPLVTAATGVTSIPEVTWVTDYQIQGSTLTFPTTTTNGSYGQNGILNVDFLVNDSSTVPEPVTITLTGAGLLGFGLLRTLRRRA